MTPTSPEPSTTSRVLAEVRTLIDAMGGTDARLPTERALSDRLGVGRRTVRRALEALEAEGLIWRRQGKGTFVGQPPDPAADMVARVVDTADVLAAMEARLALEPALARLCAARATAADVARLRALADRVVTAPDADAAELWDGALHRLIARTAGNRLLLAAFALLDEVRQGAEWQALRAAVRTPGTMAQNDRHHRAIIDAIAARDGAAAAAAMTEHLSVLQSRIAAADLPQPMAVTA